MENVNKLTIAELREAIDGLPDDMEVTIGNFYDDVNSFGTKFIRYNNKPRTIFNLNTEPEY